MFRLKCGKCGELTEQSIKVEDVLDKLRGEKENKGILLRCEHCGMMTNYKMDDFRRLAEVR